MGDWQIQQWEQGFSAPFAAFVCDRHVDDYALEAVINENATGIDCDFCDREGKEPFAVDVNLILERLSDALRRNWTDPNNVLFYDDESESGYGGAGVYDFEGVLGAEGEWPFCGDAFEEFVLDAFRESTWTGDDPAVLTESEARSYSWQLFTETVKHDARFLFVLVEEPDEEDEPGYRLQLGGAMLRELGDLINRFGLVIDLPEGETLHRVRPHKPDDDPTSAKCLGTPPPEKASQSRMSPAGIPMFYGATDLPTAYAETVTKNTRAAKAVTFTTSRAARIVDLHRLPDVPSLFDLSDEAVRDRASLGFLAGFRRDVSRPIERGDLIHIEYVPTQVVGEYLRHLFRDTHDNPVDGIAWESAQHEGGRNVVLFVRNEQCIEADAPAPSGWDEGKLALRLASHRPLDLTAGSATSGRAGRRREPHCPARVSGSGYPLARHARTKESRLSWGASSFTPGTAGTPGTRYA